MKYYFVKFGRFTCLFMLKTYTFLFLIICSLHSCTIVEKKKTNDATFHISELISNYPNVLNVKGVPSLPKENKSINPKSVFSFFDQGAWFGFSLPDDTAFYGGVIGPFLNDEHLWISQSLVHLNVSKNGEPLNLAKANLIKNNYLPGILNQELAIDSLHVILNLIYSTGNTALIKVHLENKGNTPMNLNLGWEGKRFTPKVSFLKKDHQIDIPFKDSTYIASINWDKSIETNTTVAQDSSSYSVYYKNGIELNPQSNYETHLSITLAFNQHDYKEEIDKSQSMFEQPNKLFSANQKRWEKYLNTILSDKNGRLISDQYDLIAVKSLLTLVNNWRKATDGLKYDGLIPSYTESSSVGFSALTTWIQVAGVAQFDNELAKNNIKAIYDLQDKNGMVTDVVYKNSDQNNWLNANPPLSGWAIWSIYESEKSKDLDFIKTIYPKLEKFHYWWYRFRDHDQNGLCEYGSSNKASTAAALRETGTEDSSRFKKTQLVRNIDSTWSMNLESVDLNTYLYIEKICMAKMNNLLGNEEKENKLREEAKKLQKKIQTLMYSQQDGFFHDRWMSKESPKKTKYRENTLRKEKGAYGWIPLWANIANEEQAKKAKGVMMNPLEFNTQIPFPSLSKTSSRFLIDEDLWNGPVWVDQVYFGIEALKNYGFNTDAEILTQKIFNNCKGLMEDAPINGCYHPLTGNPLSVKHSTGAAANLLLLYKAMEKKD